MSSVSDGPRRYSEEEFALILRRASEMQERPSGEEGEPPVEGLTLDEMKAIAREVGIDPEAVTRAAAVLGAAQWEEKGGIVQAVFGGPGKFRLECEVPGTLPPEEMGRVLEVIRRVWEHQGEASEVLGGVEWQTVGELSAVSVNVSPRGKQTSVQIVGNRDGAGAVTFVFPMGAAAVVMGALGALFEPTSAAGVGALVTGVMGSGFLVARTLWARGTEKFKKRMTRLMETVSRTVEEAAVPPWLEQGAGPEEGMPRPDTTSLPGSSEEPPDR